MCALRTLAEGIEHYPATVPNIVTTNPARNSPRPIHLRRTLPIAVPRTKRSSFRSMYSRSDARRAVPSTHGSHNHPQHRMGAGIGGPLARGDRARTDAPAGDTGGAR